MKTLKIISTSSLFLALAFFIIGAVFKIQSYTGGGLLLTIGGFLAGIFFVSLLLLTVNALIKK